MSQYFRKDTHKGIGCVQFPDRKQKSLIYIDGNSLTVIGTVRDDELFEKGMSHMLEFILDKEEE